MSENKSIDRYIVFQRRVEKAMEHLRKAHMLLINALHIIRDERVQYALRCTTQAYRALKFGEIPEEEKGKV